MDCDPRSRAMPFSDLYSSVVRIGECRGCLLRRLQRCPRPRFNRVVFECGTLSALNCGSYCSASTYTLTYKSLLEGVIGQPELRQFRYYFNTEPEKLFTRNEAGIASQETCASIQKNLWSLAWARVGRRATRRGTYEAATEPIYQIYKAVKERLKFTEKPRTPASALPDWLPLRLQDTGAYSYLLKLFGLSNTEQTRPIVSTAFFLILTVAALNEILYCITKCLSREGGRLLLQGESGHVEASPVALRLVLHGPPSGWKRVKKALTRDLDIEVYVDTGDETVPLTQLLCGEESRPPRRRGLEVA